MRCPVCFEAIAGAPRPCADCGTKYHPACWVESGCVVAGCMPRTRVAAVTSGSSPVWRPAASAAALSLLIGAVAVTRSDLLAKMCASLAISCWCAGGGGFLVAGFQDLGWNIPAGRTVRPDRLGTMAAMALGLAMVLVGAGCAMRVVDPANAPVSAMFCAGAGGLVLVGTALCLVGLVKDERRSRAVAVALPLMVTVAMTAGELHFATSNRGTLSVYPHLPRPR